MIKVVHNIHFPVSARSFVLPMVKFLNQVEINSELWVENHEKHFNVIQQLDVPKQFIASDLPLNPFIFYRRLSDYCLKLKATRPTVLHVHQSRASLIPLLAACIESIPVRIYHNHGLPYLGYNGILRWFLRNLELINIRLATHVLLVSHSNLAEAYADNLLPKNKGKVLANGSAVGINLVDFNLSDVTENTVRQAKQKFGVINAPFVLAYVGRPVKRKGFHFLLEAWKQSGLGLRGNVLLIAGCTDVECTTALGYSVAGVHGLGYQTDLSEFYIACDAVALPSKHEGFPYSLLEGAAYAKPLIGTDIPGIRCAIKHNETGLLVPFEDKLALTNAMSQLASNPFLRFQLGQNARKRIEQDFPRELILTDLLNFYETELAIVS